MIKVLRESHVTPQWASEILTRAGGLNRFGEPNYRVVWGLNRLTWIGGLWEDRPEGTTRENAPITPIVRSVCEYRMLPKYTPYDRWHFERWCPPEMYGSPRYWKQSTAETYGNQSVEALGPYPSRGEYEHVFCLEDANGNFVQLTPTLVRHFARMVEASRNNYTSAQRLAALREREARLERQWESKADSILSDTVRFEGYEHITVPDLSKIQGEISV